MRIFTAEMEVVHSECHKRISIIRGPRFGKDGMALDLELTVDSSSVIINTDKE